MYSRLPNDRPVAYDIDTESSDINEDEVLRNVIEHPARALEVDLELPHTLRCRHIHGTQRAGADDAVDVERVPRLETPHGLREILAIAIVDHGHRAVRQIAGHGKAPGDRPNPGIGVAGP